MRHNTTKEVAEAMGTRGARCCHKILTVHYPALIDYNTVLLVVSSCWWFVFDKNGNVKSNTKIRDDMVFKAGRPSELAFVKCSH